MSEKWPGMVSTRVSTMQLNQNSPGPAPIGLFFNMKKYSTILKVRISTSEVRNMSVLFCFVLFTRVPTGFVITKKSE
jgi:hypothetical protein